MMPVALFRSTSFSGANALTLLLYFALSGAMFFVPFNLIGVQGYSAMQAGAAFLPFTLIMGTLSRWSGALTGRYGARTPLTIGPIIVAAGLAMCAIPTIGQSYWTGFFPAMIVLGLGMAVSVAPLTTTVMQSADERHGGVASGINNATARIAGLLAVALLGAIAVGQFRAALDQRAREAGVAADIRHSLHEEAAKLAEAKVPARATHAQRAMLTRLIHESFENSFRMVMLISAAFAAASAACGWLTISPAKDKSSTDPASRVA
jgi:MFS family permease